MNRNELLEAARLPREARGAAIAGAMPSGCTRPTQMYLIREALRERWPVCEDVRNAPRGLRVDGLVRVDSRSFYVHGFACDNASPIESLRIIAPDGSEIELAERAFRHPHGDADGFYQSDFRRRESGFIAYIATDREQLSDGWLAVMENEAGEGLEARSATAIDEVNLARQAILTHLRFDHDAKLLRDHAHPAIERLQARLKADAAGHETYELGAVPTSPGVSIIIPLFGRIDLVENQLAAMARDPEVRQAELMYVLDSPELADELRAKLTQLQDLFHVGSRVVVMERNCGFANGCNVGVARSRGRRIVFMHSDVVTAKPGWLSGLQKHAAGIVGATLLYADDSIQHAGFRVAADGTVEQPGKGLHKDMPLAPTPIDAVSSACMMIDRKDFDAVGGVAGCFVDGELEDVDRCLRLRRDKGLISFQASSGQL